MHWEIRNAYRILSWKSEGKKSLERPRHRWEDDFKMNMKEVGYDRGLDISGIV
jgi:hypothetical protein